MQSLSRIGALTLLLVMLVGGCVSKRESATYPTLIGSFPEEQEPQPIVADEAYIGDDEFFVRFHKSEQTWYSRGVWSDRIDILGGPSVDAATPYIVRMLPPEREKIALLIPTT